MVDNLKKDLFLFFLNVVVANISQIKFKKNTSNQGLTSNVHGGSVSVHRFHGAHERF